MRVLFVYQSFPGQFLHVAQALKRHEGVELTAVTRAGNKRPPLVATRRCAFEPKPARGQPPLDRYGRHVARGMAVAQLLDGLRREGFVPDLVLGDGGRGETLFVKVIWPKAWLVLQAELFSTAEGGDVGFDPRIR